MTIIKRNLNIKITFDIQVRSDSFVEGDTKIIIWIIIPPKAGAGTATVFPPRRRFTAVGEKLDT